MDHNLKMVIISSVFLALIYLFYVVYNKNEKKNIETMDNIIDNLDNFNTTEYVVDDYKTRALALDKNSNTICLIDTKCLLQKTVTRYFPYTDIISSEIVKHGETVSKTSSSSLIGRAIVGGIAFGGVGAVVGGLSGKRKTSTKTHGVTLRIIVNDKENPLFVLIFDKNMPEAEKWHKFISILIKKAEQEEMAGDNVSTTETKQLSVADELLKLADLKEKGLLSENEFEVQKERILK